MTIEQVKLQKYSQILLSKSNQHLHQMLFVLFQTPPIQSVPRTWESLVFSCSVPLAVTNKLTVMIKKLWNFLIISENCLNYFLSPPFSSPQVTTDKKSLAYVDNMLKKSNKKVEELHQELQELNAHIVVKDPEELLGNSRSTTLKHRKRIY